MLTRSRIRGVCRRIPSSARERAFFRLARTAKQAMSVYIVDAAGHSPGEKQVARSQIGFSDGLLESVFLCVVALAFVLGLIPAGVSNAADPDLVGWWKFEESGGALQDSSDQQNDGNFNGTLYQQPGVVGYALGFDGTDDVMTVGSTGRPTDTFSFGGWMKTTVTHELDGESTAGTGGTSGQRYAFDPAHGGDADGGAGLSVGTNGISVYEHGSGYMPVLAAYEAEIGEDWNHIMIVYDNKQPTIYLNGQAVHTGQASPRALVNAPIGIGGMAYGYFDGLMDEIQIYSRALTPNEIQGLLGGENAYDPNPADGQADVLREADLSWAPGEFAGTHNLYVGNSFEEVESATVPTAQGLNDTSYDLGYMDFGKTIYWRVDEVNGTPDKTVFKGDVWSFEVEPYSIPIPGTGIAVTASSSSNEFASPEKTNDGSGLGADGSHEIAADTMWFTASVDLDPWIQYEFDNVKKLDTMTVWNSNSAPESAIGWGVKDVEIATSVDGENWDVLGNADQFSRAPGLPTYDEPDVIAFNGVAAKYVRMNIQSNWGGILMSYGLSEVQFSMIPVRVRTPEPEADSVDILPDTVVAWRSGRDVDHHRIYVGTDMNAVADGTAASVTSSASSLDLTSLDLPLGQITYWRVDEVNEAETVTAWAGPVWSLSIVDALTVDDFESYSNLSPDRPFQTWLDGFGYSADDFFPVGFGGNGTGAGIGHDIWGLSSPHFDGDLMETGMVYSGSQSMPVYYDGAGSQVDLPLDGENWTLHGLQTLSIAFHGITGNTGELYVKINNVKIAYDRDPADIANSSWILWQIDLSSVSGLDNVTMLSIGVDGAGAAGVLYVDDIKLYAQALESTGPLFGYVKITGDEDSGISADNTYTHALDFGTGSPGALINGVQFDAYNNAANGTLNFNREISSGSLSDHAGNGGHNVTGGLVDLMTDMYYNGGTVPGGTTTWTLSGLTAGQTYHARLYTRQWGPGDTRNATFVFDPDGAGPMSDSTGQLSQDNAASSGFANGNDAYYISYQFTAVEGEDLVITATQHVNTYSWHLYGLTNQVQ